MHMGHVNQWLRTKATYFLAGICVILMCVWLIPWQELMRQRSAVGGKIFGEEVDGNDVRDVYLTLGLLQRDRDNAPTQDELVANAWETMVYRVEAKRHGIVVTDADVANLVKGYFGLSGNAAEGEKMIAQLLSTRGLNRDQFNSALKSILISARLQNEVLGSVTLPENEAWLWYSRENRKIQAQYIELSAALLTPLVTADDAQLKAFYDKHAEFAPRESPDRIGYLMPEKVKIEYVLVPTKPYADKAVITQRQVEEYYEARKEQQYRTNPPASAEPPAEPVVPAYKPLSEVAASIEQTLRNEEAGRAADEQIREIRMEALKQIEVPWGSREVRSADLSALAAKFGAKYEPTEFFSADEISRILPGARELAQRAFGQAASAKGVPSAPMSATEGKFLFQLKDVQSPKPAEFDKIVEQVRRDCLQENALDLATEIAATARAAGSFAAAEERVKTALGDLIAKATAPEGAELEKDPAKYYRKGESSFFGQPREFNFGGRTQRFQFSPVGLPSSGSHLVFSDVAFALKKDEVGVADEALESRAVYLLVRAGEQPASREEFAKSREKIEQSLLPRKIEAVRKSWIEDLRRRAMPSPEVMKYLKLLPDWQQEA